jgi:hypothetical protein
MIQDAESGLFCKADQQNSGEYTVELKSYTFLPKILIYRALITLRAPLPENP